jgi:hypothetical protein
LDTIRFNATVSILNRATFIKEWVCPERGGRNVRNWRDLKLFFVIPNSKGKDGEGKGFATH